MSHVKQLIKTQLTQRLEDLTTEFMVEYEQLNSTSPGARLEQIKRNIGRIEREMLECEDKLKQLEESAPALAPRHTAHAWKDKRMHIDFKRPMRHIESMLEQFDLEGCTLLLMLQNVQLFRGRLFIERLQRHLSGQTDKFRPYPIELSYRGVADTYTILNHLAQCFNVDTQRTSIQQYTTHIREKILELLRTRHTIFVVVDYWDNIPYEQHGSVLREFIQNFWLPLVECITREPFTYRRSRLIVMFSCEHEFDPACMHSDICCSVDMVSRDKALRLELGEWTLTDVEEWIERHLPIYAGDADELVKKIYHGTDGNPMRILDKMDRVIESYLRTAR